jgi:hypothetical protein
MRLLASAALLTALAVTAAEPAKPNTLTAKEAADGWLLLFDGETTFGWEVSGVARAERGVLLLGGDKPTTARPTTQFPLSYQLSVEADWDGKAPPQLRTASDSGSGKPLMVWKKPGEEFGVLRLSGNALFPVPITVETPAGTTVRLRNVKLRPRAIASLFNGSDLSGWREFPARKSKFTVTPQGWLNVKDGPGDLQTEGEWDNFVLQLECISNGKHLNSGIFFRCRPGEYQQGYEAQIRNQFTEQPTQEYTIEEFDPKTHELKGKTKLKSPAVDYGTGAIYRRMPARKAASRDGEWFTLTVVAQGRHIATWVNGSQEVDWTDNRPLKDNARQGCRLEKGPISIQGHDPTTDLSFRKLRIAELKH